MISRAKTAFFLTIIFLLCALSIPCKVYAQDPNQQVRHFRATVQEVRDIDTGQEETLSGSLREFTVELENGELLTFTQTYIPELDNIDVVTGDAVVVQELNTGGDLSYFITDFQRTNVLFGLLIVFAVLVLAIAQKKGFYSLVSLAISYFLIFEVMIRQILNGYDPILVATLVAGLIIPINYYLSHGFSRKTTYAVVSTLATIIATGFFSIWVVEMAKLSGFTSDEARFLREVTNGVVNNKELLLAAIIVGTLGILDDITVSQTSIANELKLAKNKMHFSELFWRTMNIGKDHIASLVNTLILVYTSASLPLLVLMQQSEASFLTSLNREVIMEELVIMLITSIALVVAVPVSTVISCYFVDKYGPEEHLEGENHEHHHHH